MIFVCGHNELLAQKIKALKPSVKHIAYGFTSEINLLMQLSDYFIGKPGPGSLSESIHMGLPVITFKNASTMPQERFNTTWVTENQYGLVIKKLRDLSDAVDQMIAELPVFKARVLTTNNHAVFEVVKALDQIIYSRSYA